MKKLFKQKKLIKFFFNYQRKYLALAIGAGVLMLINVLMMLPMPLVTRYLIDKIIPRGDFQALNLLCLLLLGVILLGQVSAYFYRYQTVKYKSRIHFDLERDLYLHVQELPMSYFSRRPSGYILSRIGEVSATEAVMADTFFNILKDFITMLVGAVLILRFHLVLGLVSLLVLPFFILSIKIFHKRIKEINKQLKEENAQYTGKLETNINSIEKIKSTVNEKKVGERLARRLSSVINLRIKAQMIGALAGIVAAFVGMIAPFFVLWFGVSEIMRGSLSLGTWVAINSFLGYLYGPAQRLTNIGYTISQAMAGLERIYELFQEKEEDSSGEPVTEIKEIVFEKVNYSYNGAEGELALKDLNLKIKNGEKMAIVGESGQGKSTLVKMILKFYQPDTGHIYLSGKNSRDIAVKNLRQKIAYISQRQRILEEELEEKINDLQVRSLLQKFRLDKAIDNKEVHQTEFSGGELQKIELMESILRDADILIVDEGTSNIDYNSERIILNELFQKYTDKIIIFIAHRLSSVTDFERIVVIDKGRVVEEGTHLQLLRKKGKYHFLWGMQKEESQEHQENIAKAG
ncbi:MAG: ABC transporter ATP-binding protein [Candidatus Aminicenantes bacterium]|nr:MAG: ABC transporter ATP-binding protein [Candidatus Aminicenantes bacterium]